MKARFKCPNVEQASACASWKQWPSEPPHRGELKEYKTLRGTVVLLCEDCYRTVRLVRRQVAERLST